MTEKSVWTGIRRGLACRCPVCGKGKLFRSYLKLKPHCEVCGADNTIYPSDDFPPYLTILLLGHLLLPIMWWIDRVYAPPMGLELAFWVPVTAALCLALLPRMKGATVGLCWANDLVREQPAR